MPLERSGNPVDVDDNSLAAVLGATEPASALQVGGSDGTNLQSLAVDTGGRQIAVGAAADGATPVGNPVYVAGWDGTNVEPLRTNTLGNLEIVGPDADGAAAVGNPVQVGGVDGSGDVQALLTDTAGRLEVNAGNTPAGTAAITSVAASVTATGVDLLTATAGRLGATIVNDGNKTLYVAFAATVSATAFTVKIPGNGYYEVPFTYTGQIRGIWSSATAAGSARITELTA